MAFNRVPLTSVPTANYVDGQIIYGADVNTIISVFKAAVNANGSDLATMLSGERDANVVATAASLSLIQSPEAGDLAFVLNDETQNNITSLYEYVNNAWAFQYQLSVALIKEQLDAIVGGTLNAGFAEGTRDSNNANVSTAADIRAGLNNATSALAQSGTNAGRLSKIESKFKTGMLDTDVDSFDQNVKTTDDVTFASVTIDDPDETQLPPIELTQSSLVNLDDTYKTAAADATFVKKSQLGANTVEGENGYTGVATLDTQGRIPAAQLPLEAVLFKGTFGDGNDLPDGSELEPVITGDFYICTSNGFVSAVAVDSQGNPITFDLGDKAVYDGTNWSKIDNTESVTSVEGSNHREGNPTIGAVTLNYEDVGAAPTSHNHSWNDITSDTPTTLVGYGITDSTIVGNRVFDTRYYTKEDLDPVADQDANVLDPRYYTKMQLDPVAAADENVLDARYFTETELDPAADPDLNVLDARYYTKTQLDPLAAQDENELDDRYYTETEIDTTLSDYILSTTKGQAGGVVPLNQFTKIDAAYLPSYVDDVLEGYYDSANDLFYEDAGFTTLITPLSGKIFVNLTNKKTYRWSGTGYIEISPSEVTSVNTQTGAVVLSDADIAVDATGFIPDSGVLTTDDDTVEKALNTLHLHTHTEDDITDLDKYTQGEVDAKLAGKVNVGDLNAGLTLFPTVTVESGGTFDQYFQMVTSTADARFAGMPAQGTVVYTTNDGTIGGTSTITSTDPDNPSVVGRLISDSDLILGEVAGINLTTIGEVIKVAGNANENGLLRFRLYKSSDLATPIATSGYTEQLTNEDFVEVFQAANLTAATFLPGERIVINYEGYSTAGNPVYGIKFGSPDPVRTLVPIPLAVIQNAQSISFNPTGTNSLSAVNVQSALVEVDQLIQENTSVIKVQRFVITNVDNGDGTFSYTYSGNARTGTLTGGEYQFALEDSTVYLTGQNRLEIKINNDVNFYSTDTEIQEVDDATVGITYGLQLNDEVHIKVYQGLDSVALIPSDGSITTQKLSTTLQTKIGNYDTHIGLTSGNPHSVTKSEVGLGNVTNDAQVKADLAGSVDGNVATWSGTSGDALGTGYGVQTTLSSSTGDLVRADAIVTALSAKQDTLVSGTNIKTIQGQSVLGTGNINLTATAISATAPSPASQGQLWWNSTNAVLYVYYDDGTSAQWIEVSYADIAAQINALIGAAPETLDTLQEISAALQDNPDFYSALTTLIGEKLDKEATIEDVNANYQVLLADNSLVKKCVNTDPITITIPLDPPNTPGVDFPIGGQVVFLRNGAGTVTFAGAVDGGTSVTVRSVDNKLAIKGQYASATIIKLGTNEWQIIGNLEQEAAYG